MIKKLKSIFIDNNNKIVFEKVHDCITFGYINPKKKDKINAIKWEFENKEYYFSNIISSFPNIKMSNIVVITPEINLFKKSISIINLKGEIIAKNLLPNLKNNFNSNNFFNPFFVLRWFKVEEINQIKEEIDIDIDIKTNVKLKVEFPDYSEFFWIDTEIGFISHAYQVRDNRRLLDNSKSITNWYKE